MAHWEPKGSGLTYAGEDVEDYVHGPSGINEGEKDPDWKKDGEDLEEDLEEALEDAE